MVRPISDPRVFFVDMKDADGNELYETVNPLAHEVKIVLTKHSKAVLSWFDMANQSMRSVEIAGYTQPDDNRYEIKDVFGNTYIFTYINRQIWENYIHPICIGSPLTFDSDEEVQQWLLKSQNS